MSTAVEPTTPARVETRRLVPRRKRQKGSRWLGVLAWFAALLFFAPIAWMVQTSFRQESDAAVNPPNVLAPFTLDQYRGIFDRDISPYIINSLTTSLTSTLFVIALALPAAYALAVKPVRNVRGVLSFVLSTKFLPMIGALLPIYLTFKHLGMLDNVYALVVFYTGMNLPIAIWMLRSFLVEIPKDIMAAAEVDGASLFTILRRIVLPIAMPGLAATALICFIFSWNEFMFALNLTATRAGTAPVFLVSFITSEGLFLARLCAASVVVSIPVVIAGWIAQDKLVQGLSLGAVK